jgi:hypothetical protein
MKMKTKYINPMTYNPIKGDEIDGHLDIIICQNQDEDDGQISTWQEVMIHGDPQGLKSLAQLLWQIGGLNQDEVPEQYLPTGAREHYHLCPNIELSKSSVSAIIGRLDAKGTREFYPNYIAKEQHEYEQSLKTYPDLKGLIDTAFDDGRVEEKLEIAKKLKDLGVSIEIIIKTTGLSEAEIESL